MDASKHAHKKQFAVEVVRRLRDAGFEALWAGGCVRDLELGGQPDDYDVATSATPEQVQALFQDRKTLAVGAAFGVIVVLGPGRKFGQVEVATFRTETSYSDGRRPDAVTYSTAEEDAKRRDFTINGMFFDPLDNNTLDFVGGRADLNAGVIRAIGDPWERIGEDRLRMLRAVRFAARFGFDVEKNTWNAIADNATELRLVSGERMAVELQKMLEGASSEKALRDLFRLGLLEVLIPEAHALYPEHGPQVERLLDAMPKPDWIVSCCCMLLGSKQPPQSLVADIKNRLKLSNHDAHRMRFALEVQDILDDALNLPWSTVQPILVDTHVPTALRLLEARTGAGLGEWANQLGTVLEWLKTQLAKPDLNPEPLLDGRDLIEAGVAPGPLFRDVLARLRRMQLDGDLSEREQALDWLRKQGLPD